MNKIIASYLQRFSVEHELQSLSEADQFERFANFCVISQHAPDSFDLEDVTTTSDDDGLDGVAVVIDGVLISTAESAAAAFKGLARRRSAEVDYVFIQAKRTEAFDLGEMLKLGAGVHKLFTGVAKLADDVLAEFRDIHDVVVEHLSAVQHGRPKCNLFYVCTGTWNDNNGLRERAILPMESQLRSLGYFHSISVTPIDRERLVNLWVRTRAPVQATFSVKGTVALPPIVSFPVK